MWVLDPWFLCSQRINKDVWISTVQGQILSKQIRNSWLVSMAPCTARLRSPHCPTPPTPSPPPSKSGDSRLSDCADHSYDASPVTLRPESSSTPFGVLAFAPWPDPLCFGQHLQSLQGFDFSSYLVPSEITCVYLFPIFVALGEFLGIKRERADLRVTVFTLEVTFWIPYTLYYIILFTFNFLKKITDNYF